VKPINSKNINGEKYAPGYYTLYDSNKKRLYVGSSKRIKHRLQALLYGRSDYRQLPHKAELRKKAAYYSVAYNGAVQKNRKIEKKKKENCRYNVG